MRKPIHSFLRKSMQLFHSQSLQGKILILLTLLSFFLLLVSAVYPFIHLMLNRSPVFT